ncbi:MAG: uracil phosphoribosyltransferase [Flavobacteriaceae bacterium]|jgi:phosphotransferase system  glucose/maltose/N-acetylglucosamine-specific IIC component|nr:uracil phosphoribosyltransferase [Flavobacteriaceae bacterium]
MTSFFNGLGFLFEKVLFMPMNLFAKLELQNWWAANTLTWIFILITCYFFVFWLKKLQLFKENKEDEQDTTAHSFLK